MKAIILAAGSGTRLAPIGLTVPKTLVHILNRPLIQHHITMISNYVDEAIVIIGPNDFGRQIDEYLQSQTWSIPVKIVVQDQPLGTAHAYQAAANSLTGHHQLLCMNGDDLYSPLDIKHLLQHDYAALGQPVTDPEKWGILNADQHGQLIQLVEKPAQFMGNLAYTGAALLSTEIFKLYHHVKPSSRGEYEFTETVTAFAQLHRIQTIQANDYWLPIGYPWHILDAHQKLTTEPVIGENVHLGQNVTVTGSSVIGDNVVINDNTTINNSTIYSGAIIGQSCQINYSVIGQNANLNSGIKINSVSQDGSTVHSEIKNQRVDTQRHHFGAAIGDAVRIGNDVAIKAGTKIWPNITISDGSVVEHDINASS